MQKPLNLRRARFALAAAIPLLCTSAGFAQDNDGLLQGRANDAVLLNVLGNASLLSLNYERYFDFTPQFFGVVSVGGGYNKSYQGCIGAFGDCGPNEKFSTIPHFVTANFGGKRAYFEVGVGGTQLFGERRNFYQLYPIFGLRTRPLKERGIVFRLYASPQKENDYFTTPFLGASLGVAF